MNSYLISVIMPSFNSQSTIGMAINSVIDQTYENWELIVSDDFSSDGTVETVKEIMSTESRVKLITHHENRGAGYARNAAIAAANGKYIAFLDSDDLWHRQKLEKQISYMYERKISLSYTCYQKIDMTGNLGKIIIPPKSITYSQLLKSNVIGCLTAVYDQELLGKCFMPLIRKRQDMALWLDILKKIDKAYCLPENLAYYREGQESLSSNKLKILTSQWQFYRGYLQFGVVKSAYYFSFYICKALRKHKG